MEGTILYPNALLFLYLEQTLERWLVSHVHSPICRLLSITFIKICDISEHFRFLMWHLIVTVNTKSMAENNISKIYVIENVQFRSIYDTDLFHKVIINSRAGLAKWRYRTRVNNCWVLGLVLGNVLFTGFYNNDVDTFQCNSYLVSLLE